VPASLTPRTPAELTAAIVELTARLRRGGLLPDDESALAAHAVRTAIEALEAEVQRLHGELDPAEGERLDRRLAMLGSGDDDAELRGLLESQRMVLRRLEQRRLEKEARRDRLRDQLVTLWMQLVELDARVTRGTPVDAELTGNVRALSRDLARAGEALTEVERLMAATERQTVSSKG
jgi:chromosome segregation ATPase